MDEINLAGQPAEVRMTLEITRAATGKTESVELVGKVIPNVEEKTEQENK